MTSATPSVLFVCIHNAGRSQMAAGFLTALGGDAVGDGHPHIHQDHVGNQFPRLGHGPCAVGRLADQIGLGDDVKALCDRFPLRRSAGEGSKMGSRGYRRLRRWKLCFVGSLDVFGVRRYI